MDRIFKDGKYKCTAAGTGEMPIIKLRNLLIESGYDGGFSVEVFGVENTDEAIKISAENFSADAADIKRQCPNFKQSYICIRI